MGRLRAARLWLGTAGIGAVVFVTSVVAMLRSCERVAHTDTFASIRHRNAAIWSIHEARQR